MFFKRKRNKRLGDNKEKNLHYSTQPKTDKTNEIESQTNEKNSVMREEFSNTSSNAMDLKEVIPSASEEFVTSIKEQLHSPADLIIHHVTDTITIIFIENLIRDDVLNEKILPVLQNMEEVTPTNIHNALPLSQVNLLDKMNNSVESVLTGAALIHVSGYSFTIASMIPTIESRSLSTPENESQVIGSQVGFNESLSTNISLIRRYIMNPQLCYEKMQVGKQTTTNVALVYIDGITSEQHVNTVRQRLHDLDIQDLLDSAVLTEILDDNSLSIFPQMLLTERPDRLCDGLLSGKVGILVDGSSMAIICPLTFIEFFYSREDKNFRWLVASFVRLLRFLAIFISIFFTPMYVASLTFHYEVIPQQLLVPLSESRAKVPFPPVLEALFLELIIEFLREAGARLPTKIGQTIGIVGGVVLGTAAVQAGITSNILIIITALCALSSFTTPNYMMGSVIRVLRFPIIVLAGLWGFYGIMLAFCFLLVHLLRQSSLGAPYLSPFYPPRFKSWADSIIRLPMKFLTRNSQGARVNNIEIQNVRATHDVEMKVKE